MSGCLIFQRPDICSTTSVESMRASTSGVGSRSNAACSPATRPPYSATLLVARPTDAARSASTRMVSESRTSAPEPAGPGLPREPPSASTISRRVTARLRSQARLGAAHENPAAVLAAHHLVRVGGPDGAQLAAVQLDPAALALPRLEQGRPGRPGLRADPVVQRQQRGRDAGGRRRPGGLVPGGGVGEVGERVVAQLLGALQLGA